MDRQTDNTINQSHTEITEAKTKKKFLYNAKVKAKTIPWSNLISLVNLSYKTGKYVSPIAVKAVYAGAGHFGKASTGTPMKWLHGIAKENATYAWFGHGSLASGGKGIEGGKNTLYTIQAGIEIGFPLFAAALEALCIFHTK